MYFFSTKHLKTGFTLLEILIAVSVIGIISAVIAEVFYTTTKTNAKTEIIKDVKQNGEFAIDVMTRFLMNAAGVESDCPAPDTQLSSINIVGSDNNVTRLECLYDSGVGVTRIASTSATTGSSAYLTSSNVTLGGGSCADINNTLTFICTKYSDQPAKISIRFSLAQAGVAVDQF